MNTIRQAAEMGQSIWLDYIRRSFITSGELSGLIDLGVTGLTSNPSIFERSITGTADYDSSVLTMAREGLSPWQIYDELTREDVAMAADLLRPVYDRSGGEDGFVSLEVNPELAGDTEGTIEEAMRLFTSLARPNVMIKVPATPEGIPAVEELTRQGVNVNVTLIFSIQQYRDAAQAYIVGLKRRSSEGRPIHTLASVASFFVSRIDTAVDRALEGRDAYGLVGRTAIAAATLAYAEFSRMFSGHDWEDLAVAGARLQHLLWASTGTKNPAYSDTMYVDGFVGNGTVNTVPMETLRAFLDHGSPSAAVATGTRDALAHMEMLKGAGVDLEGIVSDLLEKGVGAFAGSFQSLLHQIELKVAGLDAAGPGMSFLAPGSEEQVRKTGEALRRNRIADRIWSGDHTVWKEDPDEISDRLGWLESHQLMKEAAGEILETSKQAVTDGFTQALLMGMGGSSLAPDMFTKAFKAGKGHLDLKVLDSTDPGAVHDAALALDPERTLFIVSSKSGTTAETLSHFRYFFNFTANRLGTGRAGNRFIAITDPGSPLSSLARELKFRKTFLNDPEIGGRFSALSFFGLVPAALMGIDLHLLLDRAGAMASRCLTNGERPGEYNPGVELGSILGTMHNKGVDKLTLLISPAISSFGAWLEQLLAESTGKQGKGILPVDGEIPGSPGAYGRDRLFVWLRLRGDQTHDQAVESLEREGQPVVRIELSDLYDLGGEMFRWEMATAVAGHVMGINPFDQPNVESTKKLTRGMLAHYLDEGHLAAPVPAASFEDIEVFGGTPGDTLETVFNGFLSGSARGDYVALQAFLNPTVETALALGELRHRLRDRLHLATTVGFGPRFLHSTGQLHKGDGGKGLFVQITSDCARDERIPDEAGKEGSSMTFGTLITAQAMGDRQALMDAGRRVIRFHLKGDVVEGIRTLKEAVS